MKAQIVIGSAEELRQLIAEKERQCGRMELGIKKSLSGLKEQLKPVNIAKSIVQSVFHRLHRHTKETPALKNRSPIKELLLRSDRNKAAQQEVSFL